MDFKVTSEGFEEPFSGESQYSIGKENGVLTVTSVDDRTIVYGPTAWLRVEHESQGGWATSL